MYRLCLLRHISSFNRSSHILRVLCRKWRKTDSSLNLAIAKRFRWLWSSPFDNCVSTVYSFQYGSRSCHQSAPDHHQFPHTRTSSIHYSSTATTSHAYTRSSLSLSLLRSGSSFYQQRHSIIYCSFSLDYEFNHRHSLHNRIYSSPNSDRGKEKSAIVCCSLLKNSEILFLVKHLSHTNFDMSFSSECGGSFRKHQVSLSSSTSER